MILLIDNYDSFTWNLVQRLGELDPTLRPDDDLLVVRNDKITPDEAAGLDGGRGPSHVIVSPGPCTPAEAGVSSAIIERFAGRVPVMGVCLGHQCMADLHGMRVERHPVLMHGKTSLVEHDGRGLFAGVASPMVATRYHSLAVRADTVLTGPDATQGSGGDGWAVTAWTSEADSAGEHAGARVVMGLRRVWGEPSWPDGTPKQPLEGVQFHPESFMTVEGPRLIANFLAMGPGGRRVPEDRVRAMCVPVEV